jgi:SpoVK/Ycf46/Vps4 family AAA+-type ATPase
MRMRHVGRHRADAGSSPAEQPPAPGPGDPSDGPGPSLREQLGDAAPSATALLWGPDTEAKLQAADLLAEELERDLQRTGLDGLVGAHLEETEQRLRALLAAAERSGAVLLIDEADALFGKRTDVADAHDRYADGAVLRALLELAAAHQGVVLLAADGDAPPEPGVAQRFQATVQFPRTGAEVPS